MKAASIYQRLIANLSSKGLRHSVFEQKIEHYLSSVKVAPKSIKELKDATGIRPILKEHPNLAGESLGFLNEIIESLATGHSMRDGDFDESNLLSAETKSKLKKDIRLIDKEEDIQHQLFAWFLSYVANTGLLFEIDGSFTNLKCQTINLKDRSRSNKMVYYAKIIFVWLCFEILGESSITRKVLKKTILRDGTRFVTDKQNAELYFKASDFGKKYAKNLYAAALLFVTEKGLIGRE